MIFLIIYYAIGVGYAFSRAVHLVWSDEEMFKKAFITSPFETFLAIFVQAPVLWLFDSIKLLKWGYENYKNPERFERHRLSYTEYIKWLEEQGEKNEGNSTK